MLIRGIVMEDAVVQKIVKIITVKGNVRRVKRNDKTSNLCV